MKLTAKERHGLAELAKPRGKRDYRKLHGKTRHALERKKLYGGGVVTAAGRAELDAVPNIFDDLAWYPRECVGKHHDRLVEDNFCGRTPFGGTLFINHAGEWWCCNGGQCGN